MELTNDPPQQDKLRYTLCQMFKVLCDYSCQSAATTAATDQGLKERVEVKKHRNIEESSNSQSKVADKASPADGSKEVNKQLSSNIVKLSFFCDVCELKCNNQSMLGFCLNAEQFINCDICKNKCYRQSALNFHLNGKKHKAQCMKLTNAHDDRFITPEDNELANDKPASANSFFNCDICKVKCNSQSTLNSHLNGKKHKAYHEKLNKVQDGKLISPKEANKLANDKPATAEQLFNCGICKAKCYNQSIMNVHLNGKKHKAQLEKLNNVHDDRIITLEDNKLENDKPASAKPYFNREICQLKCYHQSTLNSHLNGKKHKAHLEKLNKVQDDKLMSPEEANKLATNKSATAEQLFNCGICKAKCYSQSIMNIHLNGKKHKAQLEKLNKAHDDMLITPEDNKLANDKPTSAEPFFNCDICKVKCNHQSALNSHLNGKKHKAHYEKLNKVQDDKLIIAKEANELANDKPAIAGQLFNCGICKAKCYSQSILNSHFNGKKHKAQLEKHNKVPSTLLHHKANLKAGNRKENPLDVESDDDEESYKIDPIIFTSNLTFDDMDDVALVAEKGPVALRDFPHPRHLCGCLPFGTTSHESFRAKCFCCVCEVVAPCTKWRGINGHCHLSEKIRSEV